MRGRLTTIPASALLLTSFAAAPTLAQGIGGGLLPNVGADPTGSIRTQLESFLRPQASTAARPAWLFTPALDVSVGVTDNVYRTSTQVKGDVFTLISPQLIVSGDTASVTANLAYTPQFTIYANTSSQTQLYQYFNGQALATLVPDAVFLDLRGAITQSSLTNGGFSQGQTQTYGAQNSYQTETFSLSPYAVHRFGGWGTGTVRYTFNRTLQDGRGNQTGFQPNANVNTGLNSNVGLSNFGSSTLGNSTLGTPGYGALGNLSTSIESANFVTGENLGRYNISTTVSATQYAGASYQNSYRNEAQVQLSYAFTHKFSTQGQIGYQDINYGAPANNALTTSTGYRVSQATYGIGFTYAPNPDTNLTVNYGRYDGGTQVSFDGEFSPSPRTRFLARYSTGITSDLQQAQNQLASTTVGNTGIVTDTRTGAPVNTSNNGYNGVQNGIYRLNRLSATLLYLLDRDSFSVNVGNDQRMTLTSTTTTLNNAVVPAGVNTSSTYISGSWQHDLSPSVSLVNTAQYGISNNTGQLTGTNNQNSSTLSFTSAISKSFTATLSGSLRYTYANVSNGQFYTTNNTLNTGSYSVNTLLVGLHKSF